MNILIDPRSIIGETRPRAGVKAILDAGFDSALLTVSAVCSPGEFRDLRRNNFKRYDDQIFITETPEKTRSLIRERICKNAGEMGLRLPAAMTPSIAMDISHDMIDNSVVKIIAEETLKAAIEAGCGSAIIHPLFAGVNIRDEWDINREFYLKLAGIADELESDIKILLINRGRDVNGHIIRGICAEPQEAVSWVDRLNEEAGKDRFGLCFDVGMATLCGQDIYEAIVPLGDRLRAVIVRDCDGIHDISMIPYSAIEHGRSTDWLGFFRAMRKVDFDGELILDISDTYSGYILQLQLSILKFACEIGDYFKWQIGMERMVKKYDSRVLFGAGNMCRAYMKDYGDEYPPLFTCDNNPSRWGEEFCGLTIENPEKLKDLSPDTAIFLCNIYYDEITAQLHEMGLPNPIERFNDEYMPSFHMERLRMAKEPGGSK